MIVTEIPMSSPDLTDAEISAVHQVLQTRYLSIGPQIRAFEHELASYVGAGHGIGVNSGTSGLHLCVLAAGIQPGDLVITTPFSFIASANCILYERGIPVFVDVDAATGNIDPALVVEAAQALQDPESASSQRWLPPALRSSVGPPAPDRLKAILPVHAFGQPADMDPILEIAREFNLAVIEDACEAIGAEYEGRRAGTLGDAAVFAFYPNKQMTTGEGGMIVTDRQDWADLFCSLRNQGRDVFDAWLNHTRLGYNYRLDEMSAVLGLVQVRRIDELLAKRAQVANWYNARLADEPLVDRPFVAQTTTRMSWFVYVVRIVPPADRNEVMHKLGDAGIPSRPYFTPIHLQPFYAQTFGYRRGDYPVTEHLGDVSLALPFSGVMTEAQVDRVCNALHEAILGTV
jgi:dTDP-4-amino-4,6-dideoxygalactose transaminase